MAVTAEPDAAGLRFGTPHQLFVATGATYVAQANTFFYSPHPDGQRFLVNAGTDSSTPVLNVITDLRQALAKEDAR